MTDPTPDRAVPMVVGIVGGVAAGKSTVAELLAERGAEVIDADRIGHQMLERAEVKAALTEEFGRDILREEGRVDRGRLAGKAFGEPEEVEKLNRIVHPPILKEIRARIEQVRRRNGAPLIVLDAALLMETNLHRELCQALVFVDAPPGERRERALKRGMSEEQFQKRSRAQMPPEDKKELSDYVVSNAGSRRELEQRIDQLWSRFCPDNG